MKFLDKLLGRKDEPEDEKPKDDEEWPEDDKLPEDADDPTAYPLW